MTSSNLAYTAKFANRNANPLLASFDVQPASWGMGDANDRYGTSKLLLEMAFINIKDLVSRDEVVVKMIEPGFIKGTGLQKEVPMVAKPVLGLMNFFLARTVEQGAWAYLDGLVVKGKRLPRKLSFQHGGVPASSWPFCSSQRQSANTCKVCHHALRARGKEDNEEAVGRDSKRVRICRSAGRYCLIDNQYRSLRKCIRICASVWFLFSS